MTKEEAKVKLRKSGYNVVEDNSVVTVYISPEKSMKNAIKDVKEKLYSWGYNASFGVKQHKGAEEIIDNLNDDIANNSDITLEEDAEVLVEDSSQGEAQIVKATEVELKTDNTKGDELTVNNEAVTRSNESNDTTDDEDEWYDEEDSDMLLTEESIQFSLEDFGLDF